MKLKELCLNITDGEHGSVPADENGEYYFLNNNNITEDGIVINPNDKKISSEDYIRIHARTKLDTNDVVIASCGTIGKTCVINDTNIRYEFSRSVGIIKPDSSKLLSSYLHYYFKNPATQKRIAREAEGAVQKHFYIGAMENFEIEVPSIFLQEQIVSVLSRIDSKISLNNSICSDLEAMTKQLYDYWFVQFDFPDENGKPYKSSGGKMVWNEELKREIPEGWKLCKIGDISNAHRGISYNGEQLSSNGIPMLTLGCANKDGSFNEDGIQLYSGECLINKYLSPFDLIIYNTDMSAKCYVIGRTILVPDIFDKVVSSHHLTNIRFDDDNYKWYFYQLTQTDFFRKYIVGFSTGTNVKGLDYRGVEEFVHEFPIDDVLKKFITFVKPIYNKKSKILQENQQLTSLRDFLLPMLMNGQVKIKEES